MPSSHPPRPYFVVLAVLLLMVSIGSLYAWSVFVTPLEQETSAPRASISAVFSAAILSFTFSMLFGARLYRWLSAAQLALLTGLLAAAGFALAGLGKDSILIIGLGFGGLFGIANGLGYGLSLQLVQLILPRHRGLLTGLTIAAYTLGAAVFSGLFAWTIEAVGLAGTFFIAAACLGCIGLVAASLIMHSGISLARAAPKKRDLDRPLGDPLFWTLWLGFFFSAFAGVLVLGHGAAIVGTFDARADQMALGAALVALGNGAGRLLGGWLCDLRSPRHFLSLLLLFAGLTLLVLLVWPGRTPAMIALTLMGIGYGAVAGSYPVIVARIYGAENVSLAFGRVFTAWGLAGLAGPYVGGLLFDWTGSYDLSIATALAAVLCASLVCLALRLPPARRGP